MDCSTLGFPVLHYPLEFAQTYVHCVNDAIQPSHSLLPSSHPALSLSQHQGFFPSESALHIQWPKYWSFSFSIIPSSEYSGLISFRMDWFDFLAVQGTLKCLLQYHSWKASILQCSASINGAAAAAAAAKSLQSYPTLCNPIDGSPPGSSIPGILQARTLEWVAISFSSAWKWKVKVKSLSCVWLLATPWTAAYQTPPSMGFSRQEYWSGVPLPSPIHINYKDLCQQSNVSTF